jgi:hypothetical protein
MMNWLPTAQELDPSLYHLPLAVDHHFASFDRTSRWFPSGRVKRK